MSGEDGFLGRWARRKAEVRRAEQASSRPAPLEPLSSGSGEPGQITAPGEVDQDRQPAVAAADQPALDLASLPTIDSITASSDITAFLAKGVPSELRNAALRQAWVSDPAIRDYVGPYDYAWDFNTPGKTFGFGEFAPGSDMRKIVEAIVSGPAPVAEEADDGLYIASEAELHAEQQQVPYEGQIETGLEPATSEDVAVSAVDEDVALPTSTPLVANRRRHGGATPQ